MRKIEQWLARLLFLDRFCQVFRGNAHLLFAPARRLVDGKDQGFVRRVKRGSELPEQPIETLCLMRLEHAYDFFSGKLFFERTQRNVDLCRVMSVIVEYLRALVCAAKFQPPF